MHGPGIVELPHIPPVAIFVRNAIWVRAILQQKLAHFRLQAFGRRTNLEVKLFSTKL